MMVTKVTTFAYRPFARMRTRVTGIYPSLVTFVTSQQTLEQFLADTDTGVSLQHQAQHPGGCFHIPGDRLVNRRP